MQIESLVRVVVRDLVAAAPAEYIRLHYDSEGAKGAVIGVSWQYNTHDDGLYRLVKKNGGVWQGAENGWTFSDDDRLDSFLKVLKKRHADWPVVSDVMPKLLKSVSFQRLAMREDACLLVSLPLPFPFKAPALNEFPFPFQASALNGLQIDKLNSGRQSLGVLRGTELEVEEFAQVLATSGASISKKLAPEWGISTDPQPLSVKSRGWAVSVECDLSNLDHLRLAPDQEYRWDAP